MFAHTPRLMPIYHCPCCNVMCTLRGNSAIRLDYYNSSACLCPLMSSRVEFTHSVMYSKVASALRRPGFAWVWPECVLGRPLTVQYTVSRPINIRFVYIQGVPETKRRLALFTILWAVTCNRARVFMLVRENITATRGRHRTEYLFRHVRCRAE